MVNCPGQSWSVTLAFALSLYFIVPVFHIFFITLPAGKEMNMLRSLQPVSFYRIYIIPGRFLHSVMSVDQIISVWCNFNQYYRCGNINGIQMFFIDLSIFGIEIFHSNNLRPKKIRVVLYITEHSGNIEDENTIRK